MRRFQPCIVGSLVPPTLRKQHSQIGKRRIDNALLPYTNRYIMTYQR